MDDLTLKLKSIFATNRTALIETEIENNTNSKLTLDLSWDGHLFTWYTYSPKKQEQTIRQVLLSQKRRKWRESEF